MPDLAYLQQLAAGAHDQAEQLATDAHPDLRAHLLAVVGRQEALAGELALLAAEVATHGH